VKYKVNLKKSEEGYAVWVPGLPGCWSRGRTEEEALENIKDAIQSYLKTVVKCNKYPVNPVFHRSFLRVLRGSVVTR
jgi:predicted RNase H-like HicB family nuclease